ncbi:CENP-B like protein 2 [Dictyocoela muelleri]|nr:CENP-B like protein 2 [Dictyocoela muelleri]
MNLKHHIYGSTGLKKIRNLSKQCPKTSFYVNKQCFDDFIMIIREKIASYGENNVFICDKTGLLYKLAPSKSLVSQTRNWIKKIKYRITFLLTCNMPGSEKLRPVVIGKFKNPRALELFNKSIF